MPSLRILTVTAQLDGGTPLPWGPADKLLESAGLPVERHQTLKLHRGYLEELIEIESLEHDAIVVTFADSLRAGAAAASACDRLFTKYGHGTFPGFGEALRRASEAAIGEDASLVIAPAGVVHECFVFAFPSIDAVMRVAVESLIAKTLARAVRAFAPRE